jgi:hypothetical protein
MKLRTARALDGFVWMRSGLQLVRSQPLALASLFGVMLFGLGLLMLLPWIGPLIASALLPAMTAGWVHVIEQLRGGVRPTPALLVEPLRSPQRIALLQLGGWHAMAILLVMALADLLVPGMGAPAEAAGSASEGADALQAFSSEMLLRQIFLIPVALVFWHAPVLVHRDGASVAKALFASTVASLRNLSAFLVYAVCWMALSGVVGGVLALINIPALVLMVAVPVAMAMSAAFYASLHASVHGCIDVGDDSPAATP